MRIRPASVSLTILPPSWRAPRPPTPRRATFPLPETTSISGSPLAPINKTPPVPALSYWLPDTPSPFSPSSPINPFLVPPKARPQPLFRMASPLIPASPLSLFDMPMSPGYVVSPMGSMCAVDFGFSPISPTFLHSRTVTPSPRRTLLLPMSPLSPLSPRFMFPRTPPCPREVEVKVRQDIGQDGKREKKGSVQHAVGEVLGRKESIASVLSMGQERLRMRSNFYQWLAVRRWALEGLGEKKRGGLKAWKEKLTQGGKKRGVKMLKEAVKRV